MKNNRKDGMLVKFSKPDPETNIIEVSRILPDNKAVSIGKIQPGLNSGEDSITYISVNKLGEEILPPTSDFTEIENRFNKYAKELSEQSFMEELQAEAETYIERKESITSLRNRNNREKQIINR